MSLQQQCGGARANWPGAKITVCWAISGCAIPGCAGTAVATGTACAYSPGRGILARATAGCTQGYRITLRPPAADGLPTAQLGPRNTPPVYCTSNCRRHATDLAPAADGRTTHCTLLACATLAAVRAEPHRASARARRRRPPHALVLHLHTRSCMIRHAAPGREQSL